MKLDITLAQYQLIYQIVSTVAARFAHGAGKSCQFYNVIGAVILKEFFKIDARPFMGAAFVLVNDERDVMAFAQQEDGEFYSSPEAFHCWIETPNNYIDFTAPEYGQTDAGSTTNIPRLMFQRDKATMSESPNYLQGVGSYFFAPNHALTVHMIEKMFSMPVIQDYIEICKAWYQGSKKKTLSEIEIADDLGERSKLILKNTRVTDSWSKYDTQ